MTKTQIRQRNKREFVNTVNDIQNDINVKQMDTFRHHKTTTTLRHCYRVARMSMKMADRLHLKVDPKSLAKGAMLHDFYLYEFKNEPISGWNHGTGHPKTALRNARELFELNAKEENIIRSHMWPLTLLHPPKSKEAMLVSIADKIVAFHEMLLSKKRSR